VSKARIIHSLIVAFQRGQLHLLKGLPGLDDLLSELQSFEVSLTSTARERFEARSGTHDDLVLSLGLAVFFREFWRRYWDLEHLQQQREATAAQAGVDEWLV
jgi:hypothetical protein